MSAAVFDQVFDDQIAEGLRHASIEGILGELARRAGRAADHAASCVAEAAEATTADELAQYVSIASGHADYSRRLAEAIFSLGGHCIDWRHAVKSATRAAQAVLATRVCLAVVRARGGRVVSVATRG